MRKKVFVNGCMDVNDLIVTNQQEREEKSKKVKQIKVFCSGYR